MTTKIEHEWIRCDIMLPTNGEIVLTKVDDNLGIRNEQSLIRQNRLWFTDDMSMYVYYVPTHWCRVKK